MSFCLFLLHCSSCSECSLNNHTYTHTPHPCCSVDNASNNQENAQRQTDAIVTLASNIPAFSLVVEPLHGPLSHRYTRLRAAEDVGAPVRDAAAAVPTNTIAHSCATVARELVAAPAAPAGEAFHVVVLLGAVPVEPVAGVAETLRRLAGVRWTLVLFGACAQRDEWAAPLVRLGEHAHCRVVVQARGQPLALCVLAAVAPSCPAAAAAARLPVFGLQASVVCSVPAHLMKVTDGGKEVVTGAHGVLQLVLGRADGGYALVLLGARPVRAARSVSVAEDSLRERLRAEEALHAAADPDPDAQVVVAGLALSATATRLDVRECSHGTVLRATVPGAEARFWVERTHTAAFSAFVGTLLRCVAHDDPATAGAGTPAGTSGTASAKTMGAAGAAGAASSSAGTSGASGGAMRGSGGLGLGPGTGGTSAAACSVAAGARVPPLRPAFSRLAMEKKRHNSVLSPRVMSFGTVEDTAPVPLTRTLGGSGTGTGSSSSSSSSSSSGSSNSLCAPAGSETPRESPTGTGAGASPSASEVPSSASRLSLVSSPQSRFLTVVSHPPRPGASPPVSGSASPAPAPRVVARTPAGLLPAAAAAGPVSGTGTGTGLSAPSSPLRSPRRGGIPRLPTELLPTPCSSSGSSSTSSAPCSATGVGARPALPTPACPTSSPARGRTPASPGMGLLQSPQCSPLLDRHLAPPPPGLVRAESPCFSPITAAAESPRVDVDSPRAPPLLATRRTYDTLV